jgi:hypothetical protein
VVGHARGRGKRYPDGFAAGDGLVTSAPRANRAGLLRHERALFSSEGIVPVSHLLPTARSSQRSPLLPSCLPSMRFCLISLTYASLSIGSHASPVI